MSSVELYLDAATRENTERAYAAATRHFEVDWGGHLPATSDQVARYLAAYAQTLSLNTLKHRLAALAQWHRQHGFVDPTRAPVVRKVLKGIRTLHPAVERRATPLQLMQLGQVVDWLERAAIAARERGDSAALLRHLRDRALILLGFWRGFRGDELVRVQVEHLRLVAGEGMTCFLPHSKGDRQNQGVTYKVPALSRWCPVAATMDWVQAADLKDGPVFRAVDRWGAVADTAVHPNSLIRLMRRIFSAAGLEAAQTYSSHSLRRGFAGWANANGWDLKALMEYVGWRDMNSAMRYIDGSDPFSRQRIEARLPTAPAADPAATRLSALPAPVPDVVSVEIEARITLTPFQKGGRGRNGAHRAIEQLCLEPHGAHRIDSDGTHYRLSVIARDDAVLEETVAMLLDEIHRIADNHQCSVAVTFSDQAGKRYWD